MNYDIIQVDDDKCVGCNQCISVCPLSETNIVVNDGKSARIKLDQSKCIHCGNCLQICSHGARKYTDDCDDVLSYIKSGRKFCIAAAPSFRTNFKDSWRRIISTFREYGAVKVFDVSLGADICTWAHVKYIKAHGTHGIISQPCPVVVNYITKYRHDLIDILSPIHSPMLCTAIFIQKYLHIHDKLIFLSPCIAKADEFRQTSTDAYNFTFSELKKNFKSGVLKLSSKCSDFDLFDTGMGRIFPRPGGLKENIEFYLGYSLSVQKIEGIQNVYQYFDEIDGNTKKLLPDIIDVLNCEKGCNFGTGCENGNSTLEVDSIMEKQKKDSLQLYPKTSEYSNELFDWFDKNLNPEDFIRSYSAEECGKTYSQIMSIEDAFNLLGKHTFEERNFNCGACGSHTCADMADKISKGLNIPGNCVWKVKRDLALESKKIGEFSQSLAGDVYKITDELLKAISGLSSKNQELAAALKTIEDIASTTRLLSFNAAIEAKRAGNAGASFSVIAQEIKTLSDNSSEAENKMEQLVTDNNKMTNGAVEELNKIKAMLLQISKTVNGLAESK